MRQFILTLQFDAETARRLQELRDAHFPPELNIVPAHLTLFHQLPGDDERTVFSAIGRTATRFAPFPLQIAGPIRLGRGVALRVEAEALHALREALATPFEGRLIAQDRQKFRPHVTIQNKTSAARAEALYRELKETFQPINGVGEGLQLWRYERGPWSPVAAIGFSARD
ncbi:MAG: 2'-5' RNA ligase family protein [Pseudomonadota bacterium]